MYGGALLGGLVTYQVFTDANDHVLSVTLVNNSGRPARASITAQNDHTKNFTFARGANQGSNSTNLPPPWAGVKGVDVNIALWTV